ncbi:MAG: SDR family NAD(P)-dependent oxidoreductase [Phormidesmis sp.]
MNIEGKVALVTGASRGIGRAIAYQLAQSGIRRIILLARDFTLLSEIAADIREMGAEAIALSVDLTRHQEVSGVIAKAWRDHGAIDLLVNCAGVAHQVPFLRSHRSQVQTEIATNLTGMYTVTALIARRMAARRCGTIVNVSSLMGKIAAPTMATYSATKFAIVGFTRALRMELAPHNVDVITLLPSLTDTDMAKDMQKFRGVIPVSAETVARACLRGLENNTAEILVGWQSHLAVWCDRFSPWLLEPILKLTAPNRLIHDRHPPRRKGKVWHEGEFV